jgi:5-methylcytosine-specific restriction enzyme subunit McrC
MGLKNIFRVFEHQRLKINDIDENGAVFEQKHFDALEKFHGNGTTYFTLINKGVKFNQFVGVLQIGNLTIEILPKTDYGSEDKNIWHGFLIDMLKQSGIIDVKTTGFSSLRTKSNSILEIYFELFINEARYLLHRGLIKKYRKVEGNLNALKGSLLFPKHIAKNSIHAERFYVSYNTYDRNNFFNQLLFKTLKHINKINTSAVLNANIDNLLIEFPECTEISVSDATFSKMVFDRKSEPYKRAISMSRMILLNYFPDIRQGQNDVLALMFDMNKLWEVYVYKRLQKELSIKSEHFIQGQKIVQIDFWEPTSGKARKIIPDIVIYNNLSQEKPVAIFDTKWKNLSGNKASDDDLKQMFVYNLNYQTKESALIYPSSSEKMVRGAFVNDFNFGSCSLIQIPLVEENRKMVLKLDALVSFIESKSLEASNFSN